MLVLSEGVRGGGGARNPETRNPGARRFLELVLNVPEGAVEDERLPGTRRANHKHAEGRAQNKAESSAESEADGAHVTLCLFFFPGGFFLLGKRWKGTPAVVFGGDGFAEVLVELPEGMGAGWAGGLARRGMEEREWCVRAPPGESCEGPRSARRASGSLPGRR